jgi:hypothetical protein
MWYLPSFFIYALIPKQQRTMEVTMIWLIFMIAVLSFGGLAFNPYQVLDTMKRLLNL